MRESEKALELVPFHAEDGRAAEYLAWLPRSVIGPAGADFEILSKGDVDVPDWWLRKSAWPAAISQWVY